MDLLSASDWSEIRGAIHDVTDTFFDLPVIFVRRTSRRLSKFHENRAEDLTVENITLKCLMKPENVDRTYSQVNQVKEGFADFSQGYLLFNYQDIKNNSPSLIDSDGRPVFVPNKDSFYVIGRELTILSVNLVGPTEQDYQLVKVHFKLQLSGSQQTDTPLITMAGTIPIFIDYYDASGGVYPSSGGSGPAGIIKHRNQWQVTTPSLPDVDGNIKFQNGSLLIAQQDNPGQLDIHWHIQNA